MPNQLAKDSLNQPKISKAKRNTKFSKSPKLKILGKSTYSPRTTKKKVEDKPKSKRAVQQSFKKGLLTIKNNLKYLQPKNLIPPEYLLIIKNNSQSLEKHGSSTSATKYITLVEGELRSKFFFQKKEWPITLMIFS